MFYKRTFKSLALSGSALCLAAGLAQADQVFLDDVIVDGSICAGMDCVNGESFGFDTLRLKENNLRIKADDTSVSASFPNNDWQLTFNESANGGANKFSIDDITGGRTPFTIEAGAPSHSLYVDDGGRVGLGTATPVVELHIPDGDTPTLRLEQDGSSGFTPQTWDVAGNETNFFVRDATNGSLLPFKIKPSAPTNSLFVDTDGAVGLGTQSPSNDIDGLGTTAGLQIVNQGGLLLDHTGTEAIRAIAVFKNNGSAIMQLADTSAGGIAWNIQNRGDAGNDFRIVNSVGAGEEFVLTEGGNLTITGDLTTGGTGACNAGCDRVFTEEYEILPIAERADLMWSNGYLPNVGPTIEDAPFNITEKVGRMLNELEHAHIYIAELNERVIYLENERSKEK